MVQTLFLMIFILKYDVPPPTGNTLPVDYLSMKADKTDWILQILICFSQGFLLVT